MPYNRRMAQSLTLGLLDQWIEANPPGRGEGGTATPSPCGHATDLVIPLLPPALLHREFSHFGSNFVGLNILSTAMAATIGSKTSQLLLLEGSVRWSYAQAMHSRAMRLLQKELSSQVLDDGGHEERSASYHLLMLDRLIELACTLGDPCRKPFLAY